MGNQPAPSKSDTSIKPTIDVSLGDIRLTTKNETLAAIYPFYFVFGNELHIFQSSYSALNSLNSLLLKDSNFIQIFDGKLPTFPSNYWITDYTKPKNYENRGQELLKWFRNILSKNEVLNITSFRNGIKLNNNLLKQLYEFKCDHCTSLNELNQKKCKTCNTQIISIPIHIQSLFGATSDDIDISTCFTVCISYSSSVKIENVINKITTYITNKYYPKVYNIHNLIFDKDIKFKDGIYTTHREKWNELCSKSITEYDINKLLEVGISLNAEIVYVHETIKMTTCKHIKNYKQNDNGIKKNDEMDNDDEKDNDDGKNSDNAPIIDVLKCPIYKSMKLQNIFTEDSLHHLSEFVHFKDEYNEKPKCKYGDKCKSFVALQSGENNLKDRCHMKIYNHPPRYNRQIELSQNVHSFIINTSKEQNHAMYSPTIYDHEEQLNCLIDEVINNGFKYDLCLLCNKKKKEKPNDVINCKHNVGKNNENTLLSVVNKKMHHIRHQQMNYPLKRSEMLALVLYTGCDCNYDLCSSQRNNDYKKWKWFDYCLNDAIGHLSSVERGSYKLFSGLNKVKLNKKTIDRAYFPTYTSCSWSRHVAEKFMGQNEEGMILEIDHELRQTLKCCDVSWISKFPDEAEVLIARSKEDIFIVNKFRLTVLDQHNGVQTVSVDNCNSKWIKDQEEEDLNLNRLECMAYLTSADHCVCNAKLNLMAAQNCYIEMQQEGSVVICDICRSEFSGEQKVYHCDNNSDKHPGGFDLCLSCVAKRIDL